VTGKQIADVLAGMRGSHLGAHVGDGSPTVSRSPNDRSTAGRGRGENNHRYTQVAVPTGTTQ
jgi:hypothetical protein